MYSGEFQLTRLMRGVTMLSALQAIPLSEFQLTRLMRGVTRTVALSAVGCCKFQLTRLMRGVTSSNTSTTDSKQISTHTPHARRDSRRCRKSLTLRISTHTPHARRDASPLHGLRARTFQLTRLMRGVTACVGLAW